MLFWGNIFRRGHRDEKDYFQFFLCSLPHMIKMVDPLGPDMLSAAVV